MRSLELRRLHIDLRLVYDIIHNRSALKFDDYFEYTHHEATRSSSFNPLSLCPALARNNLRKHFFSVLVVQAWNSLPASVVNSRSKVVFNRQLGSIDFSKFMLGTYLKVH